MNIHIKEKTVREDKWYSHTWSNELDKFLSSGKNPHIGPRYKQLLPGEDIAECVFWDGVINVSLLTRKPILTPFNTWKITANLSSIPDLARSLPEWKLIAIAGYWVHPDHTAIYL